MEIYAARVRDAEMLQRASSGGAVPAIAHTLNAMGYRLCGVRYNAARDRAEHFIAKSFDAFAPAYGSKYIPSHSDEAFKEMLNSSGRYMVVGTPCQIAGFRRLIKLKGRESDFVLVDFWCHGMPVEQLWKAFLRMQNADGIGASATWRDKRRFGWSNGYSVTLIKDGEVLYSKSNKDRDLYSRHFLRSTCARKACKNCQFSVENSAADIRVGDLWGERFEKDDFAVSKVAVLTEVGRRVWNQVESHVDIIDLSDAERQIITKSSCGNRKAAIGVERDVFVKLLEMPCGFRLAHLWHLCWCLKRRIWKGHAK